MTRVCIDNYILIHSWPFISSSGIVYYIIYQFSVIKRLLYLYYVKISGLGLMFLQLSCSCSFYIILFAYGIHFHGNIISVRGAILGHKTSILLKWPHQPKQVCGYVHLCYGFLFIRHNRSMFVSGPIEAVYFQHHMSLFSLFVLKFIE